MAVSKNSKFETHILKNLDKIQDWVSRGASQKEISKKLHVSLQSFSLYLQRGRNGEEPYTLLSECYSRASVEPDDKVEAALYKSATGFKETVQKAFKVRKASFDSQTGRKVAEWEEIIQGEDEIYVQPNVLAQQFWLANRRRDKWSYKPSEESTETDFSGIVEIPAVQDQESEVGKEPQTDSAPNRNGNAEASA